MFRLFLSALRDLFRSRASLEAENVALRQHVAMLRQRLGRRRVRLSWREREFWVGLSKVWPAGALLWSSTGPRRCCGGTAKVFARTGAERPVRVAAALVSTARRAN